MCFSFYADYKLLEIKDCAIPRNQHGALQEAETFGQTRAISISQAFRRKKFQSHKIMYFKCHS